MLHTQRGLARVLLAALTVLSLTGCGGGGWPGGRDGTGPSGSHTVSLAPFTDSDTQPPRWMDIADYVYSTAFSNSFAYPASGVQVTFTNAAPLQFTINAPPRSLKPNFCYQMKIEGPVRPWTGDVTGADFVNWSLGHNGRWWDDTANLPLTDAQLPSHLGDSIRGYLYFDFMMTGRDGSVSQTSPVSNSYHVTWNETQRPRTTHDGLVHTFYVVAAKDGWAYDRRQAFQTVNLYGEREPGRAYPGRLTLPAGVYSGTGFRLTEESFHSTAPNGGAWRTVMSAPLPDFTVQ